MSECNHNDHGHTMLWLTLVLVMMGACNDCNTGYQSTGRDVRDLRNRVDTLERECARK